MDDNLAWGTLISVVITAASIFGLFYVSRHWPHLFLLETPVSGRERELLGRIEELEKQLEVLWDLLIKANEQVSNLRHQLESKNVIQSRAEPMSSVSILAIWPNPGPHPTLNVDAEADALYNSGYAYTALRGDRANRSGVILEIDRIRPTIIQIGGHGNSEGIWLSDGMAEPGWWAKVVSGRNISLMVLLSCDSSQQDQLNLSDVLVRAGVKAVISCDDKIEDKDAIKFAELLYAYLSSGLPLSSATGRAKLGLPRRAAEMIRLREW